MSCNRAFYTTVVQNVWEEKALPDERILSFLYRKEWAVFADKTYQRVGHIVRILHNKIGAQENVTSKR